MRPLRLQAELVHAVRDDAWVFVARIHARRCVGVAKVLSCMQGTLTLQRRLMILLCPRVEMHI
jgi:hypothetical protein